MVLNNTCECIYTLHKKCICTRACAPMQRCKSFFAMIAIANLSLVLREHRTGCRLPPSLLPARRNELPDAIRSRNPSFSPFSARFCCITTNLFAQCLLKVLMPFVAIKSYTQLSWKSFEPENLPCQYSCCTFNIIVDLFTNNANAIGTLCPAEVSNAHK